MPNPLKHSNVGIRIRWILFFLLSAVGALYMGVGCLGCGDENPPPITLNDPVNPTSHSLTLSWDGSTEDDFYMYYLYYDSTENFNRDLAEVTEIDDQDCTEVIVDRIDGDLHYYFRIYVEDQAANLSESSNEVSERTLPAPGQLTLNTPYQDSLESVKLSWSAIPFLDFLWYRIYYSTEAEFDTADANYIEITEGAAASYSIDGLEELTDYYFRIHSANTSGGVSPASNEVQCKIHNWEYIESVLVGSRPSGLSLTSDGSKLYVANSVTDNISVISTESKTVTSTIDLPGTYPWDVQTSPDGESVYVSCLESKLLAVISTSSDEVTDTIPVGANPTSLCLSPDGEIIYVSNMLDSSIVGIESVTFEASPLLNIGDIVGKICINPGGSALYAVGITSGTVQSILLEENALNNTISTGDDPQGMAFSPDGSKLYVANGRSSTVSVISTENDEIITPIDVEAGPTDLVVSPDGEFLYVTHYETDNVSVISTIGNEVITTLHIQQGPLGIVISPDGKQLWLTCSVSYRAVLIEVFP
ncbi:MAG: beta-propeller fold lactonase family protein [Candidatus Electryonea clarkiae]|nr:beta-propeller fold lactonase family protein [Candidatus Electryonea clarkiae]MDP8288327.1 beta-propeller fold lactonase family protein [Candidatus Electryonea clarkiae]